MVQSKVTQANALHELGYKIFLDRYAQKDMTRKTLAVGDTVIVVIDSKTGQREIGTVTEMALPKVTVKLRDGEMVVREVENVDKPLETEPEQMMDRVAAGIASVEKNAKLRKTWTENFRWLLDGWKFVPGGRILTGAGTNQELTYYNCYVVPSPKDSRHGIMDTLSQMTEIMSRGGGVGINISSLRPRHAYVKGVNGRSSGSVSWGALYSFVTGLIEQGGCFAGDVRISTDKGLIPAQELADRIDNGEIFFAHTHKGLRQITARFRNGVKPLFEVTTKRGYSVQITEDHKVGVLMDGKVTTMALKYLQKGDEILLLQPRLDTTTTQQVNRRVGSETVEIEEVLGDVAHDILPDTIVSITPLASAEVYDFEVDDVHLLSGNGIYTSNSRRGALMLILNDWHPDVFDFINSKRKMGNITNANISVGVSDKLMEAIKADADWDLVFPDTGDKHYDAEWNGDLEGWKAKGYKVVKYRTVKAKEIWDAIIESAWASAEPGVWFNERSNKMSNSWYYNPLISTNPCGEQPLAGWSVCNLGAINLSKFYDEEKHDVAWDELDRAVRYATRFLDNVIDGTPYFFPENEAMQQGERRVGLGTMGVAELMIYCGVRYGSDESVTFIEKLYKHIAVAAYETSAELASEKGAFSNFNADKLLQSGFMQQMPDGIRKDIKQKGLRNVTLLTQAPTGCVAPDTLISLKTGLHSMGTLGDQKGAQWQIMTQEVHTDEGLRKTSHFYVNGYQPVKKITTHRGFSITATHNHRLRVIDTNGDYVWKRMDEMQQGDTVVMKRGTLTQDNIINLTPVEQGNHALSDLPTTLTPDFAELLGLYMGDGYTKTRGGLHIIVAQKDPDLLEYVQNLLKTVWGQDRNPPAEDRIGCWTVNLTGYYIPRFFEANGFKKPVGNEGQGAAGAFIPEKILQAGRTAVTAFLRGLFEADGSIHRGTISLSSTSENLVKQVQIALLGLGIVSNIRALPEQQNHYGERTVYELRILNRRECQRFVETVGFISQRKRALCEELGTISDRGDSISVEPLLTEFYAVSAGLPNVTRQKITGLISNGALTQQFIKTVTAENAQLKDSRLSKIVDLDVFLDEIEVIEDGMSETFDISVPDNHTYIANGFVSHNTTGTMVNSSTGIEPFFSWIYYRKSRLGLHEEQVPVVSEWYAKNPGAEKLPDFFVTAMELAPEDHVKVQGAFQKWIDSAISKTCNVPNHYTVEQVSQLYIQMYELGCKGGTIYRDGSRDEQVLMLKGDERAESEMNNLKKKEDKKEAKSEPVNTPHKVYPRPVRLTGTTVSFKTPFGTAYITMNNDENGNPFEVFITVGKAGSDVQADAEAMGRMISLQLRTTAPQNRREMLRLIKEQMQGIGGARPTGFGPNRVLSLPDAMATALEQYYFSETQPQQLGLPMMPVTINEPVATPKSNGNGHVEISGYATNADMCPECGTISLIRVEGCRKCTTCGYSEC
jgi:ribonucleotide reductase alpha subunit/predicted RNA-binding Zn-ribbon protein involved in translation (DUF1610 family)